MSCQHYSGRKSIILLSINGHLVSCRPLEHSLEAVYSQQSRTKPFVFLVRRYGAVLAPHVTTSAARAVREETIVVANRILAAHTLSSLHVQDITIPGDHVDVNVHPTKHEVILLHQDGIVRAITDELEQLQQAPVR